MKKVINGAAYNTETGIEICQREIYDFGNWVATYTLYRTLKGAYFIASVTNPTDINSGCNGIRPISEDEAKEFCEEYGSAEEYDKEWGEPEEAAPCTKNKIKELRAEQNMTQQQVSNKSGVSLRQIQAFESGEKNLYTATYKSVAGIASAFSVRPDELF